MQLIARHPGDLDRQVEKFEEQQKRAVAANQGLFGAHDQIKMEAQQFVSETIAACIGEEGISYQEARKVVRELCQRSKGTSSKQERRSTSLPDKSQLLQTVRGRRLFQTYFVSAGVMFEHSIRIFQSSPSRITDQCPLICVGPKFSPLMVELHAPVAHICLLSGPML
jgi:hypothetical protein